MTDHSPPNFNNNSSLQEALQNTLSSEISNLYQQHTLMHEGNLQDSTIHLKALDLKSSSAELSPQDLGKALAPLIFEHLTKHLSRQR